MWPVSFIQRTNHPVLEKASGRVAITCRNHGCVVEHDSLPENAPVTHVSLFDGSLAGFECRDRHVLVVDVWAWRNSARHGALGSRLRQQW